MPRFRRVPDNLLQDLEIVDEALAASRVRRQRVTARLPSATFARFDQSRVDEDLQVPVQVAVRQAAKLLQVVEGKPFG